MSEAGGGIYTCPDCRNEFDIKDFNEHRSMIKCIKTIISNISRRDFFAAMAMHALQLKGPIDMGTRVKAAAEIADAMIKELDKKDV